MKIKMTYLMIVILTAVACGFSQERQPFRVFVANSQAEAFRIEGFGTSGGTNDQTVEIQKNITERNECSGLRITNRVDRAHFVVTMDRSEGGFSKRLWGAASRDNKIAVFDGWGDLLFTTSTRSLGNAVKDSCNAITKEIKTGTELVTVGDARRTDK